MTRLSSPLEDRFHRQIHPPLLPRVNPARDIEAHQTVEQRHPNARTTQRTPNRGRMIAGPDPSQICKPPRPCTLNRSTHLRAHAPVGVPSLRGVGTLAANGVRPAEIPPALRWKRAHRATARECERAGIRSDSLREREIERASAVNRIADRALDAQIAENAEAVRIESVRVTHTHRRTAVCPRARNDVRRRIAPAERERGTGNGGTLTLGEKAPFDWCPALRSSAKLESIRTIVEP